MTLKILTVYGTRPEAIKVAPVLRELEQSPEIDSVPVVTGQHREMLDQVNALFGIRPRHDLRIMTAGQGLNAIVARVMDGVDLLLDEIAPDALLVQGDTSTVLAASLAAFHRQIPVVHLEAGLRSGNLSSPFPEEANRVLTSRIADLHLAPTPSSRDNLVREGVAAQDVLVTGNTVIDALLHASSLPGQLADARLRRLDERSSRGETAGPVLVLTAHRRESLGAAMQGIAGAVAELATARPDLTVVLPIHRNPAVRAALLPALEALPNVIVTESLDYHEFARVLMLADVVLTDSGGVQEEAPSLGKPVLVLRDNTERPEAVAAGTVRLIGTDRARIIAEVSRLLDSPDAVREMSRAVNPYGDGRAARRVLEAVRWRFLGGEKPQDFSPADGIRGGAA